MNTVLLYQSSTESDLQSFQILWQELYHAPGQYEGMKYQPFARPNTVARLRSKEGQEKLITAYSIIGDRTDFKGQRMLRYRVESEDPMCHPKGNFFHYYWQT